MTKYWTGKKRSKEDIEKMSKGHLGKKHTEEHKKKIGLAIKGKKWTQESKNKISGSNSYIWKGGRSRGYKTGYYSTEYKQWRISVFERDSYKCQGCGEVGGYLTAHHIKSFAHYPELRLDINNGVTLCEDCHKLTDNYKGRNKTGRR
mgnify:CR=1 FL=1